MLSLCVCSRNVARDLRVACAARNFPPSSFVVAARFWMYDLCVCRPLCNYKVVWSAGSFVKNFSLNCRRGVGFLFGREDKTY